MSRKTVEMKLFGQSYTVTHLPAADGFAWMLNQDETESMMMLLRSVTVQYEKIHLGTPASVDRYVRDVMNIAKPRIVLKELVRLVGQFNFGFLDKRKQVKVPSYLKSDHETRQVEGESPILGLLVSENRASLRELEEYYSLEDAFRLYDILFIDKLNTAEIYHNAKKKR